MFATPFTAGLIAGKLEEEGLTGHVGLNIVQRGGTWSWGRSGSASSHCLTPIPEGNGLLIETPFGNLFHTGDWKIDRRLCSAPPPTPTFSPRSVTEAFSPWSAISTNVFQEKPSGSEESVHEGLLAQVMLRTVVCS